MREKERCQKKASGSCTPEPVSLIVKEGLVIEVVENRGPLVIILKILIWGLERH